MKQDTRTTILFTVSAPGTALHFLNGLLGHLASMGKNIVLVCPDTPANSVRHMADCQGIQFEPVQLVRDPHPLEDARAFLAFFQTFGRNRVDTVVAGTPKASLLALTAARLKRVRRRVYVCHGLRYEGAGGLTQPILRHVERFTAQNATDIVAVSHSVAKRLEDVVGTTTPVTVLGRGSANGVDLQRFRPRTAAESAGLRTRFGISPDAPVALFVGRLTGDKGLASLRAFATAAKEVQVVVAGPADSNRAADLEDIAKLSAQANVRMLGNVLDVENLYPAADVLLLPTKREGLPTVVLEAAACGVPTIAMRATGTVDCIVDQQTGVLVAQGDVAAFVNAARAVLAESTFRRTLGAGARLLASEHFAREHVWSLWDSYLR